mmetsp:Transcript_66848/g.159526  ORF Transcript_66848/g.159526 Transcript_66848/m.159526 type:complete len:308 (-) Transcript_66848:327-1250(-)
MMRPLGKSASVAVKFLVERAKLLQVFHVQLAVPAPPPRPIFLSESSLPVLSICKRQAIDLDRAVPRQGVLSKAQLLSEQELVVLEDNLLAHPVESSLEGRNLFDPRGEVTIGTVDHPHLPRRSGGACHVLVHVPTSRLGRGVQDNVAGSFEGVVVLRLDAAPKTVGSLFDGHVHLLNLLAAANGALMSKGNVGGVKQILNHEGMVNRQVQAHGRQYEATAWICQCRALICHVPGRGCSVFCCLRRPGPNIHNSILLQDRISLHLGIRGDWLPLLKRWDFHHMPRCALNLPAMVDALNMAAVAVDSAQ